MKETEYFKLLKSWCDGLIRHQVIKPETPSLDGALLCPACALAHGRIQDAMFPMVYVYSVTGDRKYYDAGMRVFHWAENNMRRSDGAVDNDKGARWKGITVFSQTSLGHAVLDLKDAFDKADYEEVYAAFVRESDAICDTFMGENFNPNINYFYGIAAAMAYAYKIIGKQKYLKRCRAALDKCLPLVTDENLIGGETHDYSWRSPKGNLPLDIGYNMEESVPLLAITGYLLEDEALLKKATEIALAHAEFILPDGGIDNSFGCRANKWTYWGSRTSDGLAEGFIYLLPYDKSGVIDDVIYANFRMLAACTYDDMLYGGIDYYENGELPCLHHAFTHIKALAAMCIAGYSHKEKTVPHLPRNREYGVKHFKSADVTLVSFGSWCATISGNDAYDVGFETAVTSGGSLNMLWHPETGALCCATPDKFVRTEPTNMQFLRESDAPEYSLTPRLYTGNYSSVYDLAVSITREVTEEAVTVTAKGTLKNVKGETLAPYEIRYTFGRNRLDIDVTCDHDGVWYTLPLGASNEDTFSFSDRECVIDKSTSRVVLSSDTPLVNRAAECGGRTLHTVSGLHAVHPQTRITGGKTHFCLSVFPKKA